MTSNPTPKIAPKVVPKIAPRIAIASDHAGFALKSALMKVYQSAKFIDLGCPSEESVDYPLYARKVVNMITSSKPHSDPHSKPHSDPHSNPQEEASRGVLICGSGMGMSISANRHRDIRAALCTKPEEASLARRHNDANILVLPGRFMDEKTASKCLDEFLSTEFEGGRHLRRVRSIDSSS